MTAEFFFKTRRTAECKAQGVVTYVKLHSRSNTVLEENSRSAVIYVMNDDRSHFPFVFQIRSCYYHTVLG